jgi:hypothetical protein
MFGARCTKTFNIKITSSAWLLFLLIEPSDERDGVYRRVGAGQTLDPFTETILDGRRLFKIANGQSSFLYEYYSKGWAGGQ